ncbi:TraK family protein [Methylotetracoccus oryzae]|uniref:TraK family protein n=1 Tax=Methylotetracoccus oryzae TaxID=1919059 RepID=UPI00111B13B3|nr:TraK family protein [Methylotetracoccus oryzae]
MSKPLEERIAERIRDQPDTHPASGRVAFLALKDDIARAVAAGWPVKSIWYTLFAEGRIAIGYHAFNLYVNKYVRTSPASSPVVPEPSSATPKPRAPTGFTLNPQPKKEDLV